MIGRKIKSFWALSLTVLLFTGCSSLTSQAKPISSEEAKTLALTDAGIPEGSVEHTASTLSSRNQLDYYAVTFTANGMKYEYDIDAMTGTVIESRTFSQKAASEAQDTGAAGSGPQAAPGNTGSVQDTPRSLPVPSGGSSDGALLTEAEAKEKALANAGFSTEQVTFSKFKLDWEDGRQLYEIDFYTGENEKYSYEIDAGTGEIVSRDYEIKNHTPLQSGSSNETMISSQKAKEIALKQVPGAKESDIREFKTDHDDGRLEYEGEIIYNEMKYEFEIDGYSGAIRSWEAESVYY